MRKAYNGYAKRCIRLIYSLDSDCPFGRVYLGHYWLNSMSGLPALLDFPELILVGCSQSRILYRHRTLVFYLDGGEIL